MVATLLLVLVEKEDVEGYRRGVVDIATGLRGWTVRGSTAGRIKPPKDPLSLLYSVGTSIRLPRTIQSTHTADRYPQYSALFKR